MGGQKHRRCGCGERCEIQVAYAIGVARPMSVMVETFGTETVSPAAIEAAVDEVFDLRPGAILRDLDLKKPRYRNTAAYAIPVVTIRVHLGTNRSGNRAEVGAGSRGARTPSAQGPRP